MKYELQVIITFFLDVQIKMNDFGWNNRFKNKQKHISLLKLSWSLSLIKSASLRLVLLFSSFAVVLSALLNFFHQ